MKVCVFCSSNSEISKQYVDATLELGKLLGASGHTLVFGGYSMGLMGKIAHSVLESGGGVIGVTTESLSLKGDRVVFPCTEEIVAKDLAERKNIMIDASDVYITLPGGIGTFDEFFSVLSQKKAHELNGEIILINTDGYFDPMIQMLDDSVSKGLNSNDWRKDCMIFSEPEEAIQYLNSLPNA